MSNEFIRDAQSQSGARILGIFSAALLVVVVLAWLVSPPSRRDVPTRTQCLNNIRNIGLAILNYTEANHGHFPPAYIADKSGRPVHSWRALIVGYMDQPAIARSYRWDEPWNGPHNSKLAEKVVPGLHCPDSEGLATEINYLVVVGPRTAFPGSKSRTQDDIQHADGTANTLLLVEVANSGVNWLEPRDLKYEDAIRGINQTGTLRISSRHPHTVCVCFVDGHVTALDSDTKPDRLKQLLLIDDGGPNDSP